MSAIREELCRIGKQLIHDGMVVGAGGNISAADGGTMYISPSGLSFEDASADDYVGVSIQSGEIVSGTRRPSSEVLMHLFCYRKRPDIGAVIHTHPRMTIALISSGHNLKPMYADFYVYLGDNLPHIDYVTVTTPELARAVESVVEGANAILLRNHGAIALGANLKQAYFRTLTIEEGAFIQYHALQAGAPVFLSKDELSRLDTLGSEQYRRSLLEQMKKE